MKDKHDLTSQIQISLSLNHCNQTKRRYEDNTASFVSFIFYGDCISLQATENKNGGHRNLLRNWNLQSPN